MKKMDLHIHTVSTKRDKPFAFSIEKLKGYVIQEKVDLIAITNHNLFDAQQFSDITNISRKSVLLDCLEAGEAAYMDRRNSYEILNG